ncbi:AraC family transcriptional regulator [Parahaliea mediterranea]|uniref:AraC family transcriptional regulator n=1 Tax=Parahaliea mediterranea TaxID=651086 RepID=UPI000E2F26FB|nr:AraC family transcriptional regulator [Parahaliea mediterranea]
MVGDAQQNASVMGAFILPVATALRLRGEDPLQVMADIGLDPARVANPEWRLPEADMQRLLQRGVALTGDEAFGLFAALQLQPQVLRSLGLAWLASDTVYDGLRRMIRFSQLLTTGSDLRLEEDEELVRLYSHHALGLGDMIPCAVDFGLAVIVRMCRLTMGEYLAPVSVQMVRPPPTDSQRWEYQFAAPVSFGESENCLSWSRSDIEEPLVTGDPGLARVNDEHSQAYLDSFFNHSTSRDVVGRIIERLPDGPPSQRQIADALHLSNRTLQRKLKEEGTSFMDLLQDTRLQLARKYLRSPGRSVVETAYLLGFSEPSTFSRAFKRWTGQAPAQYREQSHH